MANILEIGKAIIKPAKAGLLPASHDVAEITTLDNKIFKKKFINLYSQI